MLTLPPYVKIIAYADRKQVYMELPSFGRRCIPALLEIVAVGMMLATRGLCIMSNRAAQPSTNSCVTCACMFKMSGLVGIICILDI